MKSLSVLSSGLIITGLFLIVYYIPTKQALGNFIGGNPTLIVPVVLLAIASLFISGFALLVMEIRRS